MTKWWFFVAVQFACWEVLTGKTKQDHLGEEYFGKSWQNTWIIGQG